MDWLKNNFFTILALTVSGMGVWFTAQNAPLDKRLALVEQSEIILNTRLTALELQSKQYVTREELNTVVLERTNRIEEQIGEINKYLRENK
jgi:uncharacterized coiled-coil protein SlyX